MKKIFASLMLIASLFAFSSCNDDDQPRVPTYIGMGTLDKIADQYTIAFDGASTCTVADSSLLVYNKLNQPGKRLIALYSYISDRVDDNTIYLQDVKSVLTKDLAVKPATPEDDKKLGNDPLRVDRAWLGGGFLNVKFRYFTDAMSGNPHFINAYDTGVTDKDGNRIIEMRHNAYSHQPIYVSYSSYVSFALPGYEEGKTTYSLRYRYNEKEYVTIEVDKK